MAALTESAGQPPNVCPVTSNTTVVDIGQTGMFALRSALTSRTIGYNDLHH